MRIPTAMSVLASIYTLSLAVQAQQCGSVDPTPTPDPETPTVAPTVVPTPTSTPEPTPVPEPFISEYLEGPSFDKAIEIFNPTLQTLDLSFCNLGIVYNGGNWDEYSWKMSGMLAPGQTHVVANAQASQSLLSLADQATGFLMFNGNDAIGLFCEGLLLDAVGREGEDPIVGWDVAGVEDATFAHSLIRKDAWNQGTADWSASAGTTAEDSQWLVYSPSYTSLGYHPQGGEDAACQASNQCLPGLLCTGKPHDVADASGCCVDNDVEGEGTLCDVPEDCGEGLTCILGMCNPAWMARTFTSRPNVAIPDGDPAGVTDGIVASCLATVPVTVTADIKIQHPTVGDLIVTVTDASGESTTTVHNRQDGTRDNLEIYGVPINHTGDNYVNGVWTIHVVDAATGDKGTLVEWTLHISSRWD